MALLGGDPADRALVWVPFDGPVRTWTYADLRHDVEAVAAGLQRRGVRPGDRVALVLDNSPEFVLGWLGTVAAGAVAVSLNTRSTRDDLSYYGSHAAVSGTICSSPYADDVAATMPGWVTTDLPSADGFRPPAPDPTRAASIQYTSGTTARPKAVVWTLANCHFGGRAGAAHQSLTASDVNLVHLPLFHTNALSYSLLSTLWAGGTVVLQPRFSASRFWDVAVTHRCTWTAVVSFCVRALANREAPAAHAFRGWGNSYVIPDGTGPGGIGSIGWFGMTETVSHPICGTGRPGSMGRPAPEYEVRIEDGTDEGLLLVRGVRGESLFAEYLGDAAATAAAFTDDGWFRTGDRVRRDPEGTYTFVERDKDVLKVGGENVGAPEIERILLSVAGVREAAVVGRPHPMLGEVPVAFVLADPAADDLLKRIEAACAERLPTFKRPAEVRVVDAFPRSTLDKVAKAELRRIAAG